MIEYRDATAAHIRRIANRMGEWDRIECAASGRDPVTALRLSLGSSAMAWTAMHDGRPIAMWGVTPLSMIDGIGAIWLLGTDDARRHPRAFVEGGREMVGRMLRVFDRLENYVAMGNRPAVKLLIRLGAIVGSEVDTRGGVDFIPFWIERGLAPLGADERGVQAERSAIPTFSPS